MLTLTDANFEADVLRAQQPVLLDVWAPWCEPCGEVASALERLSDKPMGGVVLAKASLDDCRSLPRRLGVSVVPTLILFAAGEERKRIVGVPTDQDLLELAELAGTCEASSHGDFGTGDRPGT